AARILSASSVIRSVRRAASATVAPMSASACAVAVPMPLDAPVTRATVPSSWLLMVPFYEHRIRGAASVHSADRRGAVGVEGLDRLPAPGLARGRFGFGPGDRPPVRREHQPGGRVAQLDPVAAWLVDVQEERL